MPVRIVEWKLPYTGWTGIEIDTNKVISLLLREENNLIMVNEDNEVYTDLQLSNGLTPLSDFPVWVTVWKILEADGWTKSGLILNWKTTSGDYARWIYATDGELYFDNGTGTWKQVYYSTEVDSAISVLRDEIYEYFMKYSDFNWSVPTWTNVVLSLNTEYYPTADFVVNAPSTVKDWQTYILRVTSWETTYVMSLWENIINLQQTNINLTQNATDMFVFLAVDGKLELQKDINPNGVWTPNDWQLTIQKNGTAIWTFTADQATNTTVNVEVPTVVNNLTSTSTTDALSANQWKILNDKINDLFGQWKFLSLWNAATGQPLSFPYSTPYAYSTWDYFLVEVVDTTTNYRPNGSSYTWTASSTVETDEIEIWDVYIYDGSVWLLQSNHWKTVNFWNIAWDPYDNTNLWNALNAKQDTLTAWANITIDPNTNEISASNTTYSSATTTTAGIVKLWSDTAIAEAIQSPAWATNKTYPVQLNSSGQMWVNVPRANTTYWAWDNITIDWNNNINADVNTKMFRLFTTSQLTVWQEIYDWYNSGKNPIIYFVSTQSGMAQSYEFYGTSTNAIVFAAHPIKQVQNTKTEYTIQLLRISYSNGTVTSITEGSTVLRVLETDTNYSTPYTPQNDWSPATKKYVDDNAWIKAETVTSGDSGTTYKIRVRTSAPASWTADTVITFVK